MHIDEVDRQRGVMGRVARQEELLARLFERLPVMITLYDPSLGEFVFNDEFRRVLGWTEEDARSGDFMARVYPDAEVRSQALEYMTSLASGWREFPVTAKDGTVVASAWANLRLSDETQVGIGLDLRMRKQSEEALRESEERYRTLFTSMTEGFALGEAVLDEHGRGRDFRLLEMNAAFEQQTGLPRERARGRLMREVLPGLEQSWVDASCGIAFGEPARHFENYNRDLDRHFNIYCFSPRRGQFAILFTDVTERKRAETALRESDRRKDEFIAVLSHELRNPLAPIRFALRVLESEGGDNVTIRRSLDVIDRQVTQLVRLIDDLLDVSRITRNKIHLRRERVEIAALIRAIVDTAEARIASAGHRLTTTTSARGHLDVDPARIVQVFANLLNNAAKFTPPGGEIALNADVEGSDAVIRVRDNGIGIPAEAMPRIFEMFHQVESATERSGGGLGIGLALARRLVEMHGGTIDAHSAGRSQGAEFTVRLPLADVAVRQSSMPLIDETGDRTTRPLGVLVVDDNVDSAEMLALLVKTAGHRTRVAHDGPAAMRLAEEFRPDVVLLDIGLPGMDGYEVARALRRSGRAMHLVAITGWGQPEDRRMAREAGFDCHMTKPADADLVLKYLDAVSHRMECSGCAKCLRSPLTRLFDPAGEV